MPTKKKKKKKNLQSGRSKGGRSGIAWMVGALVLACLGESLVLQQRSGTLLAMGWVLLVAGGLLLWRQRVVTDARTLVFEGGRELPRWVEVTALVLIMALALGLRVHNIENYPNAGFRDEGENGNVAIQMMNNEVIRGTDSKNPAYIEMNTQNAAGYFYPTAVAFKLFGVSITSVRYVSIFFGTLSVLAFYALARMFFGAPVGLLLALALALLRWHLNFSRIGFLGIMTVFLEIPVFYFLYLGLRQKSSKVVEKFGGLGVAIALALCVARGALGFFPQMRPYELWIGLAMAVPMLVYAFKAMGDPRSRMMMLSGIALALSMYSYMAARPLVIVVLGVVLHHVLTRKEVLDARLRRALWVSGIAGIVGLALLVQGSAIDIEGPEVSTMSKVVMGLGRFFLVACALSFASILYWRRKALKGWMRPLALSMGISLVVAGPLYSYTLAHTTEVNARSYRVSVWNDEEYDKRPWGAKLKENIPLTNAMYNFRGDGNPRHNYPGETMFNPGWAALLAIGIFLAFFRFGDPRHFMLLLWWQVTLIGGYLSIEAPQAYRTITSIPPLMLALGLVMERIVVSTRRGTRGRAGWLAWPLLLAVVVAGGWWETKVYFEKQPTHPGVWAEFSAGEYLMGKELKSHQPGTKGLARPDWADSYTFRFVTYPERDFERFVLAEHVPLRPKGIDQGKNFLYLLDEAALPFRPILESFYPGGVFHEERHPMTGTLLYWSFFVPASEVEAASNVASGLNANYYRDERSTPETVEKAPHWIKSERRISRIDPFLMFNWTVSPVPGYFSAEWDGKINIDKAGKYGFHTYSNNYVTIDIDGKRITTRKNMPVGNQWGNGEVYLSEGKHRIKVQYYDDRNYSRLEVWWTPPGQEKQIIPSKVLSPQ